MRTRGAIAAGALVLMTTSMLMAAVPPLSDEQRENAATVVIVGTVTHIESHLVQVDLANTPRLWSLRHKPQDRVYDVSLLAETYVKGDGPTGTTIHIGYRHVESRPPGWVGPVGQQNLPKEGMHARFYVLNGELLEPNGWDLLPTPAH